MKRDRRSILKRLGATGIAGLAGCSGSSDQQLEPTTNSPTGTKTRTARPTFENEAGVEVGRTFETVEELAQEEGEVTFYAVLDRSSVQKLIEAFNEEYPGISVNHVTGGDAKLLSRWDTEYKTDNIQCDLLTVGVPRVAKLWENGQVMKLSPEYMPSFGSMPSKFKGDNSYWISLRQLLASLFYNEDLVSQDEVSDYIDVTTDSAWGDKQLGWDPTPDMGMMNWLWNRHGRKFFENLRDQQPYFVDSHTDLARLCGAGEFPVCFTYTHKMGRFGDKMPLNYFKLDKIPSGLSPAVINNRSRRPNAALLFLNWFTSEKGQTEMGKGQYIPAHPEATYTGYPGVYPSDEYEVDTFRTSVEEIKTMQERWKEVMGGLVS